MQIKYDRGDDIRHDRGSDAEVHVGVDVDDGHYHHCDVDGCCFVHNHNHCHVVRV